MIRKNWQRDEEKLLIEHYKTLTILELVDMFLRMGRPRNQDSINAKIKRLKAEGKIEGGKTKKTIKRALQQRGLKVG